MSPLRDRPPPCPGGRRPGPRWSRRKLVSRPARRPAGRRVGTPRHFCASQLYLGGMDLIAIQATLGHAWIATTMNYVHVPGTHIEDAWISGQQRAAARLKGLFS